MIAKLFIKLEQKKFISKRMNSNKSFNNHNKMLKQYQTLFLSIINKQLPKIFPIYCNNFKNQS